MNLVFKFEMASRHQYWDIKLRIRCMCLEDKENSRWENEVLSCSCIFYCCSVAKLCVTLWPYGLQHTRLLCLPLSSGVCSNSCPCYLTISSSAARFSFCLQSFLASGSLQWVSSSHQVARVLVLLSNWVLLTVKLYAKYCTIESMVLMEENKF